MKKNSLKILIAAALVMLVTGTLTGCSSKKESATVATQRIVEAQEMVKTVTLSLAEVKTEGENTKDITLRLTLNNPEKKPITSVQAWLAYNPKVLQGLSIDTDKSAFEIVAPYDNNFDQIAGLVMLGRSSATPVSDKEIVIADLHFKRMAEGAAMIEAYDFRPNLEGHTSANTMLDGSAVNILLKPVSPLVIINN